MSALDRHIEQLVRGEEPDDDFPKNESSWEELHEFGKRRIADIVELRKRIAVLRAVADAAEAVVSTHDVTEIIRARMALAAALEKAGAG